MTFDQLVAYARNLPFFTPRMLMLAQRNAPSRSTKGSLSVTIHRWIAGGRIERLCHGAYRLCEPFVDQLTNAQAAALVTQLVQPSYLSLAWALQFHGLIPDAVREFTAVTRKPPRSFVNSGGRFSYRHLHEELWWGYVETDLDGQRLIVASPVKAIVDYWHFHQDEWTVERQQEMRWQGLDDFDFAALTAAVKRVARPRITRAHQTFIVSAQK